MTHTRGRRQRKRRRWHWLLVGVAAGLLVWWQAVAAYRVSGDSMAPTLPDGSLVLVIRPGLDRLLGLRRAYVSGDLVIAAVPGGLSVKRVVAVGPASVSFEHGRLSVDGRTLAAPYADRSGATTLRPVSVSPGELYLLGDDRRPLASRDSRDFGPVPRAAIRGRVLASVPSGG